MFCRNGTTLDQSSRAFPLRVLTWLSYQSLDFTTLPVVGLIFHSPSSDADQFLADVLDLPLPAQLLVLYSFQLNDDITSRMNTGRFDPHICIITRMVCGISCTNMQIELRSPILVLSLISP
jgi:hypothetical protein